MAGIFSYGLGLEDLDENRAEAPVEGDTVVEERVEESEVVEKTDDQVTDAEATDVPAEAPVEGVPTDAEAEAVKDAEDAAEAEAEAEVLENEQLETELLEAQAEEQEIHEMDDAMEDAEGALDDHQELIESLEMIAQDGGMNRQAARFYQLSRKSIYGRLGIRVTTESFAMEAFDDVATRVVATVRSLEEEKSNFRKFLEGTKKFLLDLFEKIQNFILKILDTNNAVRKRAEKLASKLDGASFEGVFSEAQQKRLGKYFVVEGKTVDIHTSGEKAVEAVLKTALLVSSKLDLASLVGEVVTNLYGKDGVTPIDKNDALIAMKKAFNYKLGVNADKEDVVLANFPANYQLKLPGVNSETKGITFGQSEDVGEVKIGKELMIRDAGKAKEMLTLLTNFLNEVEALKELTKTGLKEKIANSLVNVAADRVKFKEGDDETAVIQKNGIIIASTVSSFIRQYMGAMAKVGGYLSNLSRVYLEVVEVSMKGASQNQEDAASAEA